MAIRHVNDRWYLYMGHLWHRGWSIVDVTDAENPKVVKFIPWPKDNTWTIQMEIHGTTYFNAGLRIFNIEDPRLPKEVGWFIPPTPTKRVGPIPAVRW